MSANLRNMFPIESKRYYRKCSPRLCDKLIMKWGGETELTEHHV